MDRSPETAREASQFNGWRAGLILLVSALVLAVGSWIVRVHPNSGYEAGFEATTAKGEQWVRAAVEAAGFTALAVCDQVHEQADQSTGEPRYDRETFLRGCGDAIDRVFGRHVPMGPAAVAGD